MRFKHFGVSANRIMFIVNYCKRRHKKKTPETGTKRFLKRVGATIVHMARHGLLVAERCSVNLCGFGAYPLFSIDAQASGTAVNGTGLLRFLYYRIHVKLILREC